jgi:D-3-phosphoglycerate dehydrogenase
LGELAELAKPAATNRAEFIEECKDGKLDGVVAIYRTFHSITITGRIDEELAKALPTSLKYIASCGMFSTDKNRRTS